MTTSHSDRATTPLYELAAQYHELATPDDPELPEEAVWDTLEGLEGALTEKAIKRGRLLPEPRGDGQRHQGGGGQDGHQTEGHRGTRGVSQAISPGEHGTN